MVFKSKFLRFNRRKVLSLLGWLTVGLLGLVALVGHLMERANLTSVLLGGGLPKSAKNKDYNYRYTMSGVIGNFCAEVSKPDFLKYVNELRETHEVGSEGGLSAAYAFRSGHSNYENSDCWVYDQSEKVERYSIRTGSGDSAIIAY